MQARAAQAPIYNARYVRTSHLVSGDKTARRVLSLVILTCISSTNTPLDRQDTYANRLKYHSMLLQVICDADMFFLDCYTGWPGSVHDTRVFRNSPVYLAATANPAATFPHNSTILGDSAYPLKTWCLTPFKGPN